MRSSLPGRDLPEHPRRGPAEALFSPRVRESFPALAGAPEVYLDSAATTQKPRAVIETVRTYHASATANAARGTYPWATALTQRIAAVRERTARFIGAAHTDEIVFTGGATAALNAVALCWGLTAFRDGDEILYSPRDHAANVHPWYLLRDTLARFGRRIHLVPYRVTATGAADIGDIADKTGSRTRLLTVTHLHHVFGSTTVLDDIRDLLPERARVCYDCSQSGGHLPVDMSALDADFAVFAAHKMFAAPGTGILYCHRRVHPELRPFLPGGTTDARLTAAGFESGQMPGLLEGGTPNIPGILALGTALEVLESYGMAAVAAHNTALTQRLVTGLREIGGVDFLPGPAYGGHDTGHGIVSFTLDGISAADLGFVLAEYGFLVRTGAHCVPGGAAGDAVRVSTQIYTGTDDIDRFLDRVRALAQEIP
ncbi:MULTISPECIES: aminotransferase class V-fold PLP-dependent enzyme [Nocardia]|uniref:aminotransferase class V-fold PLP-dependent enzyme n=1 Tax=Nocardia TaxID=1817 RepID=UPI0018951799|nr:MULTISPECIES: aminotransferase class V-fold PLP-dependent enzyme [Nocardia]MBF6347781.1 aminotransferase class V-fold PLP-dependent enzyme [Nocardia flavorosea]